MSSDPGDSGTSLENQRKFIESIIMGNIKDYNTPYDLQLQSFQPKPFSLADFGKETDKITGLSLGNLAQERNRAVSQAGSLASGRGYSLGLNNPFALSQRAEQGTYDTFNPQFGDILERDARMRRQNISESFSQGMASGGQRGNFLMQLLGIQSGNLGQIQAQPGFWDIASGLLQGGAQTYAATQGGGGGGGGSSQYQRSNTGGF